jgi:hypothetical protein
MSKDQTFLPRTTAGPIAESILRIAARDDEFTSTKRKYGVYTLANASLAVALNIGRNVPTIFGSEDYVRVTINELDSFFWDEAFRHDLVTFANHPNITALFGPGGQINTIDDFKWNDTFGAPMRTLANLTHPRRPLEPQIFEEQRYLLKSGGEPLRPYYFASSGCGADGIAAFRDMRMFNPEDYREFFPTAEWITGLREEERRPSLIPEALKQHYPLPNSLAGRPIGAGYERGDQ